MPGGGLEGVYVSAGRSMITYYRMTRRVWQACHLDHAA